MKSDEPNGINFYINELLKKTRAATDSIPSKFMFRGIPCPGNIQSSASHRLLADPKITPKNQQAFIDYHSNLVRHARLNGYDIGPDGKQLNDLEVLAEIQHYGGATCLVDFSTNFLISLFFASAKLPGRPDQPGTIFLVNLSFYPNTEFYYINNLKPDDTISGILKKRTKNDDYNTSTRPRVWIWKPNVINNRIRRQDSIFLFSLDKMIPSGGDSNINYSTIEVFSKDKERVRRELEMYFGISARTVFDDLPGFAGEANKRTSPIDNDIITKARCGISGMQLFKQNNYSGAINLFSKAISCKNKKMKNCTIGAPNTCNSTRQEFLFRRGATYLEAGMNFKALADFEEIIKYPDPERRYYRNAYRHMLTAYYNEKEYKKCFDFCIQISESLPYPEIRTINIAIIELSIITNNVVKFASVWKREWEDFEGEECGANHRQILVFFYKIAKIHFDKKQMNDILSDIGSEKIEYLKIREKDNFVRWSEWNFSDLRNWVESTQEKSESADSKFFLMKSEISKIESIQESMFDKLIFQRENFADPLITKSAIKPSVRTRVRS